METPKSLSSTSPTSQSPKISSEQRLQHSITPSLPSTDKSLLGSASIRLPEHHVRNSPVIFNHSPPQIKLSRPPNSSARRQLLERLDNSGEEVNSFIDQPVEASFDPAKAIAPSGLSKTILYVVSSALLFFIVGKYGADISSSMMKQDTQSEYLQLLAKRSLDAIQTPAPSPSVVSFPTMGGKSSIGPNGELLNDADLKAWWVFYDTLGGVSWARCFGSRSNPCECAITDAYKSRKEIICTVIAGEMRITSISLPNNNIRGKFSPSLLESFGALTGTVDFTSTMNHPTQNYLTLANKDWACAWIPECNDGTYKGGCHFYRSGVTPCVTQVCKTDGGYAPNGAKCKSPISIEGQGQYYGCLDIDQYPVYVNPNDPPRNPIAGGNPRKWCSTTDNYSVGFGKNGATVRREWGYCDCTNYNPPSEFSTKTPTNEPTSPTESPTTAAPTGPTDPPVVIGEETSFPTNYPTRSPTLGVSPYRLNAGDLEGWQVFYDALGGSQWFACNNRDDPCSLEAIAVCSTPTRRVKCEVINGDLRLTKIILRNTKLRGFIPSMTYTAFGKLTMLNELNLSNDVKNSDSRNSFKNSPCVDLPVCALTGVKCDLRYADLGSADAICPTQPPTMPNLAADDLAAWQLFYDAMGGQQWYQCPNSRTNPCSSCKSQDRYVTCEADELGFIRLTRIVFHNNGLKGVLPTDAIESLQKLKVIDVSNIPLLTGGVNNDIRVQPGLDCISITRCFTPTLTCLFTGTSLEGLIRCTPTQSPTLPTRSPSKKPTTRSPTRAPTTPNPTNSPTKSPTKSPSVAPTRSPSDAPTTRSPTEVPTRNPTTKSPTRDPTRNPTSSRPTTTPTTHFPTRMPTDEPTTSSPTTAKPSTKTPTSKSPTTISPTTGIPTTSSPTTAKPTTGTPTNPIPTAFPTQPTTIITSSPTRRVTKTPTTQSPTEGEYDAPITALPTKKPSTRIPTLFPSLMYDYETGTVETLSPTNTPTARPSAASQSPTTLSPTTRSPTTVVPTTKSPTPVNRPKLVAEDQAAWEAMYDALDGASWLSCNSRSDPCYMKSVLGICGDTSAFHDVQCAFVGNGLKIVSIQLRNNNMKGTLPVVAIANGFSALTLFDLSNTNSLVGRNAITAGTTGCLFLPRCMFDSTIQCNFDNSGASVCQGISTPSPTPSQIDNVNLDAWQKFYDNLHDLIGTKWVTCENGRSDPCNSCPLGPGDLASNGVECQRTQYANGTYSSFYITRIVLRNNNLRGDLPASAINAMTKLTAFDVSNDLLSTTKNSFKNTRCLAIPQCYLFMTCSVANSELSICGRNVEIGDYNYE